MSEHSNTATDSSPTSGEDDAGEGAQDTTAASRSAAPERPPSANRSGPDRSLRNFGIALFVASAVVVVAAYVLQGGLH